MTGHRSVANNQRASADDLMSFLHRVLIVAAVVILSVLLWQAQHAFVLGFAAVIVAVILVAASRGIRLVVPIMSQRLALATGIVLITIVFALVFVLVGSQIQAQMAQLATQVPDALKALEVRLGINLPGVGNIAPGGAAGQNQSDGLSVVGQFIDRIAATGISVLSAIGSLILVVVAGVFLAERPEQYRRGVVLLFPRTQQERVERALQTSGHALYLWLLSQLVGMLLVGVLVGVGTWLIGLPAPLALGLFAGLAEFVPVIGPIVGAIPALLLALQMGTAQLLWTIALFAVVQQVESNIIMPILARRMAKVPAVLLLLAIVVGGLLFGIAGLIIAAPLTVVVHVLVKTLYVRETLGEDTEIPGEGKA